MKVKTISRPSSTTTRECSNDLRIVHRNLNPRHHPHQSSREYARAVQSSKLHQMFSKPFLRDFPGGHRDGLNATAVKNDHLSPFVSGSVDGDVKLWDVARGVCVKEYTGAHAGLVTGLAFCGDGGGADDGGFLSCGYDGYVKRWDMGGTAGEGTAEGGDADGLIQSWHHSAAITAVSHKWGNARDGTAFATASTTSLDLWNYERSESVQSYDPGDFGWGEDTITHLKFNATEVDVIGFTSSDRGVGLIDTRMGEPLAKTVLAMKSNALEWNPMEPMNFLVANEDHNSYLFDMRKLTRPIRIFKGHVGPVLTVSFSPTGKEFVSGGYDKTLRIFPLQHGYSRDCYHLRRMQIIRTVNFTMDAKYIISGSDDSNLRLWKAKGNDVIGQMKPREALAMRYRERLVEKYRHTDGVRQIKHSRPMPKYIKKRRDLERIQKDSQNRKHENRMKHSAPGTVQFKAEKSKVVVDTRNVNAKHTRF